MIDTQTLQILIGLGAAYTLFGPQLLGLAKRLITRTKTEPPKGEDVDPEGGEIDHYDAVVQMLYSLVNIRSMVTNDPKAVEAIDTIITPAILRSGDQANAQS